MGSLDLQTARAVADGEHGGDEADARAVRDAMRAFRQRHVEPQWEQLDRVDAARERALWQALVETGLAGIALREEDSGIALSPLSLFNAFSELGAASPALAAGLLSHLTAQAWLVAAGRGCWPMPELSTDARCAWLASPLDVQPETGFSIRVEKGKASLCGEQRVMLPAADVWVIPARGTISTGEQVLKLCVLESGSASASFDPVPSSHGLCFLPFGSLRIDHAMIGNDALFDWPQQFNAAHLADGLLTAVLAGINEELVLRASDYARQRYQAGKMISEHHAVQQLLGPMEIARRPLQALALARLDDALLQQSARNYLAPLDAGSASAFAAPLVRRGALDAVQTFGGYGYMQDYRVERYLRDANTLETFWIHAAQRERAVVQQRCAAMARGEAA